MNTIIERATLMKDLGAFDDDVKIKQIKQFKGSIGGQKCLVCSDEYNLRSVKDVYDVIQDTSNKPIGVWYGLGTNWLDFLIEDMEDDSEWGAKRLRQIVCIYDIIVNYNRILTITSDDELDELVNKYGIIDLVNWERIQDDGYCGVELHWNEKRADKYDWFSTWDVSSGCIWNKKGIKSIKPLVRWDYVWTAIEFP